MRVRMCARRRKRASRSERVSERGGDRVKEVLRGGDGCREEACSAAIAMKQFLAGVEGSPDNVSGL